MFKRLIWFGSGAVSGAAGSWYVKKRIQEKIDEKMRKFTPGGVREQAVAKAKQASGDAKGLWAEGRRMAKDYKSKNSA